MKASFAFNDHVCAEMVFAPIEKRTGRLVQIRKGVGAFGSDIYLIRLRDGSLMSFSNVSLRMVGDKKFEDAFYRFNHREPPVIPEQAPDPEDSEDAEYSILEEWPETGFIIEHPRQPLSGPQSFGLIITGK